MSATTTAPEDATASAQQTPVWWNGMRWDQIGLAVLLLGTAAAYFWNLTASSFANSFYAAAVQAGSQSWKAFFFGSSDAANAITVDKTPLSLWPMELSARIFGFNSGSMLAPQVLIGVASVALLWATVRRSFGATAGLLAGLALAVTPVAALMFRFNNPDAMLVLLMIAAVWAMTRAVEDGRWRWLVLTGTFVGLGFLAKQLQVMLVLPALVLAYLIAGPPELGKRIVQLFAAGAAMVVSASWWVLIAQLWPADSRPYFGGSKNNSIVELTLGYNGLDRISSSGFGSGGGGRGGFGGSNGLTRMFTASVGGQIAWLIPAALLLFVTGILLCGKSARTDTKRAGFILLGTWGLVTGLVFSFMSGIFHEYYTVALAPAVAGVAGAGGVSAWRERKRLWVRLSLVLSVLLTGGTSWILLSRTADFVPWLRWLVVGVAALTAVALLVPTRPKVAVVTALAAVFVGLAGPVAYSAQTLSTGHSGAIVTAGPSMAGRQSGAGGPTGRPAGELADGAAAAPAQTGGGRSGMPGQGARGPSEQLVTMLSENARDFTWVAAAVGSNNAATYQLSTEFPVMAIGGFSSGDPAPTLTQFQEYVADGEIHYFIAGSNRGGPGMAGSNQGKPDSGKKSTSAEITEWVQKNYTALEIDGVTLYDLTAPTNVN